MESRVLDIVGRIAGIGGLALGVFLLLFQEVLATGFAPLRADHAFAVISALMILTFGISALGITAWVIARSIAPRVPVPPGTIALLVIILLLILASVVLVLLRGVDDEPPIAQPTQPESGEAQDDIEQDAEAVIVEPELPVMIQTSEVVLCQGEHARVCPENSIHLGCEISAEDWADQNCERSTIARTSTFGGNQCGYGVSLVSCTEAVLTDDPTSAD